MEVHVSVDELQPNETLLVTRHKSLGSGPEANALPVTLPAGGSIEMLDGELLIVRRLVWSDNMRGRG